MEGAPTITVRHAADMAPIEAQAVHAMVQYLNAITSADVSVMVDDGSLLYSCDRIVIGQPYVLATYGLQLDKALPEIAGSYYIRRAQNTSGKMESHIIGTDAEGVRSGVYAFLEQMGCSFHLYGDILPDPMPALSTAAFDITRTPRFSLRGMQPWNYWYVGRDSWSYDDWDAYLTQFPKLGLNVMDFPLYLYEPLFTDYRHEGHLIEGHMLAGINTDLARISGDVFGDRKRFVSPDVADDGSQTERNAATISLMRKVFARARELGIRTCVDIEIASLVHSNPKILEAIPAEDRFDDGTMLAPSSPSGKALLRTRLEALVGAYPDCDYYGLWQPEGVTMFDSKGSPHPDDVAFRERHAHLADRLTPSDFDYLQWLHMAHTMMAEIKPSATLTTGGWGADPVIAVADEMLPPNIIRSTLGYYEPSLTLKTNRLANYAKTKGPKWHITWGEVDQRMWVIQPKTQTTAKVLDQLEDYGVEGALLLHWRLLFSDFDISLFAKSCWTGNDRDTALSQWISAKFGAEVEVPMRAAINAMEEFVLHASDIQSIEQSVFWVGFDCGVGGVLFAHRYIGNGAPLPELWLDDAVRPHLTINTGAIAILKRAVEHSAAAMALAKGAGLERLAYLDNRIRTTLALHENHLVIARALLAIADAERGGDVHKGWATALELLAETDAEAIVCDFTERLGESNDPEKGELGLLLSLNVKFVGGVRRLEGRLRRALGLEPALLAPSPASKLFVICGTYAVQRSYTVPQDSSMIWTHPRTETSDHITAAYGFGLTVGDGIKVGRVNPDTGLWLHPQDIVFSITAPAGFQGRVRLYMYYEPDFDSAFCWQEPFVNGISLGVQKDYFCHGPYWDEGVWVEADIAVGDDGAPVEIRIASRARLEARLSAIEVVAA